MSDQSSRQQHPEADLLAAFAESSLTPYERESVLSHLAVCASCRQLVFLAHQAQPAPDTQTSSLQPSPFWRRRWFPLVASASAVAALALVTFSWYGQFHKQPHPPVASLHNNGLLAMPSGNQNAPKPAEVAPPPAVATHERKPAAKRVPPHSNAQQALTSPSPATALDSVEASDTEARRLTEEESRQTASGAIKWSSGSTPPPRSPKPRRLCRALPLRIPPRKIREDIPLARFNPARSAVRPWMPWTGPRQAQPSAPTAHIAWKARHQQPRQARRRNQNRCTGKAVSSGAWRLVASS